MTIPSRFQPIHFFRRDRSSATFLATDHRLGRNEVVVKISGKTTGRRDADVVERLLWYQGVSHSILSEMLDAGLSRSGDLYSVRSHYGGSEFFSAPSMDRVKSLLSAVDFLYSKGQTHGSIKPTNIFTSGQEIRLADPWLGASSVGDRKCLSEEDVRFTAPEVLAGGLLTPDSDLYSIGAVLYRFYSGRDPFEDSDMESLKAKYIWASPRPLSSVSHVSREIGDMVAMLLHRDPTRRQTAFEALKNEFDVAATPASRAPAIGMNRPIEEVTRVVLQKRSLRVIVLEAPPGLGKTRLMTELRNRGSLNEQSVALCELKGQQPERGLAEALISIVDEQKLSLRNASLSRLRELISAPEEGGNWSDPEAPQRHLVSLLAAVAQQTRLLLVIEDVDRSNKRAVRFLESLIQQPVDLDLAILVTCRPPGVPAKTMNALSRYVGRNLHQIRLQPLTNSDSEKLVSFFSHDRSRRALAQERSAGNPLFLEAYAQDGSETLLPKVVRTTLSEMISKIPKAAEQVAEILSIFSHPVTWNVLVNMTGLPESELRETADYLHRIGFIEMDRPMIR